jgi:hypothetical protein
MPYIYAKVDALEDSAMVGSHQCVALVQHYARAPVTSSWKQGAAVLGNRFLAKGTAIATFVNGRYANQSHGNHAALFIAHVPGGIVVMDQWKTKKDALITSRTIRSKGKNRNGSYIHPSDNADAFFVID